MQESAHESRLLLSIPRRNLRLVFLSLAAAALLAALSILNENSILAQPRLAIAPDSPTSAPSSATNWVITKPPTPEKNPKLREWIAGNRGRRVLIVQADNRRFKPSVNLSDSYVHASVLSMHTFALRHNYSYVWVTESSPGAHGKPMAGYWNKVPASMLALRLARRAGIPFVVVIDTDAAPSELFDPARGPCDIPGFLRPRKEDGRPVHFAVGPDSEFWARLVAGMHVYDVAINSGGFVLDTSEHAERLLYHWWLVSTNASTPYEIQRSRLMIKTKFSGEVMPNSLSKETAAALLRTRFNGLAFVVEDSSVNLQRKEWTLRFYIFPRQDFKLSTAFLDIQEACCGPLRACSHLALMNTTFYGGEESVASVECCSTPSSTLAGWPGEQDRLNWLVDRLFRNTTATVSGLALCHGSGAQQTKTNCFQHLCNTKGPYIGSPLFTYVTSKSLKTRLNLEGVTRDEWEQRRGRALLQQVTRVKTNPFVFYDSYDSLDDLYEFE